MHTLKKLLSHTLTATLVCTCPWDAHTHPLRNQNAVWALTPSAGRSKPEICVQREWVWASQLLRRTPKGEFLGKKESQVEWRNAACPDSIAIGQWPDQGEMGSWSLQWISSTGHSHGGMEFFQCTVHLSQTCQALTSHSQSGRSW